MLPAANARARTTARYRIVNLHSRPSWCSLRLVAPVGKWILGARQGRTRPPHRTGGRAEPRRRCAVPSCSATARVGARIRARDLDHAVVNCRTRVCYEPLRTCIHCAKRPCLQHCAKRPCLQRPSPWRLGRTVGAGTRSRSDPKSVGAESGISGQAANLAPGADVGWSACSDPPLTQRVSGSAFPGAQAISKAAVSIAVAIWPGPGNSLANAGWP
jgi:hypothetical protein